MKKFIAYFDLLGFKDFIYKNDLDSQKKVFNEIFVFIEKSLAENKFSKTPTGVIANISNSTINVTNFSDTIIFWTNDDSQKSLEEFLRVTHLFNWQMIRFTFPLRGTIAYGEIEHINFCKNNTRGALYNINSVYGKGIVDAHIQAESQNWAGTVIRHCFIEELSNKGIIINKFIKPYAKKYKVPYKNDVIMNKKEFVYTFTNDKISDTTFKIWKKNIENNFSAHKKNISHESVQEKLINTITFIKSFK